MNTNMKTLLHYIQNEPFYIRAEKLLERKFTGSNVPEGFRLCSIIKGFSYLTLLCKTNHNSRNQNVREWSEMSIRLLAGFSILMSPLLYDSTSRFEDGQSFGVLNKIKGQSTCSLSDFRFGFLYSKINMELKV